MPAVNSAASQALAGDFAPAWFIYCNFSGDILRLTTFGQNFTFSGTGDPDLDGNTFTAFDGRALDISDVTNSDTGSDTLTVTLSGIGGIDQSLLNDIATRSIWQGQDCRLWFQIYDPTGVTAQGAIVPYYTGKMSSVTIIPADKTQAIQLTVETYLAAFNEASNRSYLNQSTYDAADTSAAATLAAANGPVKAGIGAPTGGGGSGGQGIGAYRGLVRRF